MRNGTKWAIYLRRGILMGIVACLALTASGSPQDASSSTVHYRITDLGTLPDCDVTYATAVNDSGWVVGYAYEFVSPGHGNSMLSRPFLWRNGKMEELPKLGGEYGMALTINSKGDIGGYADTKELQERPVIWRKSTGYVAEALSNQQGRVTALLDGGTAVGEIKDSPRRRAVLWKTGKMQMFGNPGDVETSASGVNGAGTVVGYFIGEGGIGQSVWSPGDRHAAVWNNGQQMGLPGLGGLSECRAINETGIAVGWASTSAHMGGQKACVWKAGTVEGLPTPEGCNSEAYSINSQGVIVGECGGPKWAAYVWHDGRSDDLNTLIPEASGWKVYVARYISNNGFIVGYGTFSKYPSHRWRAFLLR